MTRPLIQIHVAETNEDTVREMTDVESAEWQAGQIKKPEQVKQEIVDAVQQRLDDFAKTRAYFGILSCCTYATSTNATFAAEAQYCVEKRDETWAKVYAIEKAVEAGKRPMPSGYGDIEAELPALTWPATSA
jgi:hypothetical protein